MADNSYSELLTARVELNLSDFEDKMRRADEAVDSVADVPGVRREGSETGFESAGDELIRRAEEGLRQFAMDVMLESLHQVPRDTETLANSHQIGPTVHKADRRISVEFGYGYGTEINPKTNRMASQYALPVHEIYDAHHSPPEKSHFLIDPLIEQGATFGTLLKRFMQGKQLREDIGLERRAYMFRTGGGEGIPPLRGPGGRFIPRPKA